MVTVSQMWYLQLKPICGIAVAVQLHV